MILEWFILGGLAGFLFDVILNWATVREWISERLTSRSDYATLVQQKLASGKVRVRAGVFSPYGTMREESVWECDKLDEELKNRFGNRSEARITL